jgi:phosphatidate cytidylyltransferase
VKNIIKRIVLVASAIPILYFLALYVPAFNHLPLVVIVLIFVAGSALELVRMLEPAAGPTRLSAIIMLALAPSLAVYAFGLVAQTSTLAYRWLLPTSIAALGGFMLSVIPLAFIRSSETIIAAARTATTNALIAIYPGAMAASLIALLAVLPHGGELVIWFSLIVFANDSLAWLVGVTLGRTRGLAAVSPKKSLEGFIAGMVGSVAAAMVGPLIFPSILPGNYVLLATLGFICGLLVIVGDLFESAIKRAVSVKDSGTIIPGRGGILDSFDSLLFTAPAFAAFISLSGLA